VSISFMDVLVLARRAVGMYRNRSVALSSCGHLSLPTKNVKLCEPNHRRPAKLTTIAVDRSLSINAIATEEGVLH
jgi:hypothetical protein